MNIVEKLKQDNLKCCGCTACYSICPKNAITMQEDNEGFKYPIIDLENCVNCNLCAQVCPLGKVKQKNESDKTSFACMAKDENFAKQSSSGGGYLQFWQMRF